MSADVSDLSLVRRVQSGDKGAFDALVRKYQHKLVKLVMRYVRNPAEAEDIAQETFIRAYRALPQFRGDSAFYTWLYRIAVNTAKKSLMELKRDPLVTESARASRDEDEDNPRVENEPSDAATPDAVLASKQIASAVNFAVE